MNKSKVILIIVILLSISANILSTSLGIGFIENGYMKKPNWYLYPLFFLVVGYLTNASWTFFINAWHGLSDNGLLYQDNKQLDSNIEIQYLFNFLNKKRKFLIFISCLLGISITTLDAGCLWNEFIFTPQVETCKEVDFSVAYRTGVLGFNVNLFFNILIYSLQAALIAYGFVIMFQISLHSYTLSQFERLSYGYVPANSCIAYSLCLQGYRRAL